MMDISEEMNQEEYIEMYSLPEKEANKLASIIQKRIESDSVIHAIKRSIIYTPGERDFLEVTYSRGIINLNWDFIEQDEVLYLLWDGKFNSIELDEYRLQKPFKSELLPIYIRILEIFIESLETLDRTEVTEVVENLIKLFESKLKRYTNVPERFEVEINGFVFKLSDIWERTKEWIYKDKKDHYSYLIEGKFHLTSEILRKEDLFIQLMRQVVYYGYVVRREKRELQTWENVEQCSIQEEILNKIIQGKL
jgi:hypothetical protein